jgi:hypothetical protein
MKYPSLYLFGADLLEPIFHKKFRINIVKEGLNPFKAHLPFDLIKYYPSISEITSNSIKIYFDVIKMYFD